MKILFIHHVPDLYGSSRCLLRLATRLVADGHAVASTLAGEGPLRDGLEGAGVRMYLIPDMPALHRRQLTRPTGWIRLARNIAHTRARLQAIVHEFKPDIIHTNSAALLPVAGAVAKANGIPHVQHVRESFLEFGPVWRVYRALLARYATRIIAISGFVSGTFSERQRADKVRIIYDGLPVADFEERGGEAAGQLLARHRLGHPLVVLAGRIKLKRKGQDVLVRAAALLRGKHPEAFYALAGSPFPGNEDHLERLKVMIREAGLGDRVVLTGHLDDPRPLLAACDIAVMASSTPEPLGNVTIEAMAFAKPVVGTDCGATRELVRDGVNGLLVPPDDPERMAAALDVLLSDADRRGEMGRRGREDYLARFEFEPHYRAVLNLYGECRGRS